MEIKIYLENEDLTQIESLIISVTLKFQTHGESEDRVNEGNLAEQPLLSNLSSHQV